MKERNVYYIHENLLISYQKHMFMIQEAPFVRHLRVGLKEHPLVFALKLCNLSAILVRALSMYPFSHFVFFPCS